MINLYADVNAVIVNVYGKVNSGKTLYTLHLIDFLDVGGKGSVIHHYGESSKESLNRLWGLLELSPRSTFVYDDTHIYSVLGTNTNWREGDVILLDASLAFNGISPIEKERAINVLRGAGEFRKVTIFIEWQLNHSVEPTDDSCWGEDVSDTQGAVTFDFKKYIFDDNKEHNDIGALITKTTITE